MAETEITAIDLSQQLPRSQDTSYLRAQGLAYIEQFAHKLWTDYNVHDPGVTLLEQVCYALSDLGLRAETDIVDFLTEDPTGSVATGSDMFHTAANVLPNAPLTALDIRKLLVDLDGIRNAVVLDDGNIAEDGLGFFCLHAPGITDRGTAHDSSTAVGPFSPVNSLKGLRKVVIELEDGAPQHNTKNNAIALLHANRNLCDDLTSVSVASDIDYAITANIELIPGTDPEKTIGTLVYAFSQYFKPSIQFRNLRQMLERGYTIEEIFAGPRLQHGFIDPQELALLERPSCVFASDLIALAMRVEGIRSVTNLTINNATSVKLSDNIEDAPRVVYTDGDLTLSSGQSLDDTRVRGRISTLQLKNNLQRSAYTAEDLPIPEGEWLDLGSYVPVTNEFPSTYGIGPAGLPGDASQERIAQARQLKGYLMFFEQVLANYFAQLGKVKDLLSWRDDPDRTTYMAQEVQGIVSVADLYVDGTVDLTALYESDSQYALRKNRILDHLLARFNERITDYSLVLFERTAISQLSDQVDIKINFLQNYPALGANRGLGANIKYDPVWQTDAVSGYKKRVAALLGMADVRRRFLFAGGHVVDFVNNSGTHDYVMEIKHNGSSFTVQGTGKSSRQLAIDEFNSLLVNSADLDYIVVASPIGFDVEYDGTKLGNAPFSTEAERDYAITSMQAYFDDKPYEDYEGFHVVEHILTRQRTAGRNLLKAGAFAAGREFFELRSSNPSEVVERSAGWQVGNDTTRLLSTYNGATKNTVAFYAQQINNWEIYLSNGTFKLHLWGQLPNNTSSQIIAIASPFATRDEANLRIAELHYYFNSIVQGWSESEISSGFVDSYSGVITVVLPSYMKRSRDPIFQKTAEDICRLEAPAHVSVDVKWVEDDQMESFELAYKDWLVELQDAAFPEDSGFTDSIFDTFIDELNGLNNAFEPVYAYLTPKASNQYTPGEVIAWLDLAGGQTPVAKVGAVPSGSATDFEIIGHNGASFLNVATENNGNYSIGDIYVATEEIDPFLPATRYASPGNYTIKVYVKFGDVWDERIVYLTILPELEVTYTIPSPAQFQTCFSDGDVVAEIDGAAGVTTATLASGDGLPNGLALIPDNGSAPLNAGDIIVEDASAFNQEEWLQTTWDVLLENGSSDLTVVTFQPQANIPQPPANDSASGTFQSVPRSYELSILPVVTSIDLADSPPLHTGLIDENVVLDAIPAHSDYGAVVTAQFRGEDLAAAGIRISNSGQIYIDSDGGDTKLKSAYPGWDTVRQNGINYSYIPFTADVGFANICAGTVEHSGKLLLQQDRGAKIDYLDYDPADLDHQNPAKYKPQNDIEPVKLLSFIDPDGEITNASIVDFGDTLKGSYANGNDMLAAYGLFMDATTGLITLGQDGGDNAGTSYTTLINKASSTAAIQLGYIQLYFKVRLTDSLGGKKNRVVTLIFSSKSEFTAKPAKTRPVHGYEPGNTLVSFSDSRGIGVASVKLLTPTNFTETSTHYYLPFGMMVSKSTGAIEVASGTLINFGSNGAPKFAEESFAEDVLLALYNNNDKVSEVTQALRDNITTNPLETNPARHINYGDIFTQANLDRPFKTTIDWWEVFLQFGHSTAHTIKLELLNNAGQLQTVETTITIPPASQLEWKFGATYQTATGDLAKDENQKAVTDEFKDLFELQDLDRAESTEYTELAYVAGTFDSAAPVITPFFTADSRTDSQYEQRSVIGNMPRFANTALKLNKSSQNLFKVDAESGNVELIISEK